MGLWKQSVGDAQSRMMNAGLWRSELHKQAWFAQCGAGRKTILLADIQRKHLAAILQSMKNVKQKVHDWAFVGYFGGIAKER